MRHLLGQAKTLLIRKPRQQLSHLLRWGPRSYFRIESWKQQMESVAHDLPSITPDTYQKSGDLIELWFMTGARHWYQTAFCAWSFALHSDCRIRPIIIDDGTLKDSHIDYLKKIFPDLAVHDADTCTAQRESLLALDKYPFINRVIKKQLLFRKLTDVFCGSSKKRLFLDSDMLFYRRPAQIEEFMLTKSSYLVQSDCWESYGYSRSLCEQLTGGARLPKAINIGVLGMSGSIIDWDRVEYWLSQMISLEGWKYNITQCTAAMILAGSGVEALPASLYEVLPSYPKKPRPLRVMEHYVSDSKPYYFQKAWRELLGA